MRRILIIFGSILLFEKIRKKSNQLEQQAKVEGWSRQELHKRQNRLLILTSFLYGIFLSFGFLYFFISLTEKIVSVYAGASWFKSNLSLMAEIILSYWISVFIFKKLIPFYIKTCNPAAKILAVPVEAGKFSVDKLAQGFKFGKSKILKGAEIGTHLARKVGQKSKTVV